MYPEDLAALENPVDESVIDSLRNRMEMGESYSFIGDILLSLNSNEIKQEFSNEVGNRTKLQGRIRHIHISTHKVYVYILAQHQ